jgi:hypothetical protein
VPPPAPPLPLAYQVSLSGMIPSGIWGTPKPVTLTGRFVPDAAHAMHSPAAAVPWFVLIQLGFKVLPVVAADVAAGKEWKEVVADVLAALAGQFGGIVPPQYAAAVDAVIQMCLRLLGK